jgi:hypothetical protein
MQRRYASVQELLPLDEIAGDVIVLRGGECRAVLEARGLNFALRSETEQDAILAGFRRFLNGLSYPVQLLVRVVPTDIDRYLACLRAPANDASLRQLLADHQAFVRRLAGERTLLERRFYVVVPAGQEEGQRGSTTALAWRRRRGEPNRDATGERTAARRLALRCGELAQGLAAFGLSARRLDGHELAGLWQECLGVHKPSVLRPRPITRRTG